MKMHLFGTCLAAVPLLFGTVSGAGHHYLYWNTTTPMFRTGNTGNAIAVNSDSRPAEYDQVTFVCPSYDKSIREEDTERYVIYNVTKEEYDTCQIHERIPRIIAMCNEPYKLRVFTTTIRRFTPLPGGLEFRPGHDYYFISTSARGDLFRRVGGSCSTHNMKIVFKVHRDELITDHFDSHLHDGTNLLFESNLN